MTKTGAGYQRGIRRNKSFPSKKEGLSIADRVHIKAIQTFYSDFHFAVFIGEIYRLVRAGLQNINRLFGRFDFHIKVINRKKTETLLQINHADVLFFVFRRVE